MQTGILGENQDSTEQISKGMTMEKECLILFQNLASFGLLDRDKFLNFVSEAIGKEHIDQGSSELSNVVISSHEELLRFFLAVPNWNLDTVSDLNNMVLKLLKPREGKEELSGSELENESRKDFKIYRDPESSQLEQESQALNEESLFSDLNKLKEIAKKCRKCRNKVKDLDLITGFEVSEIDEVEETEVSQEMRELKEKLQKALNDGLDMKQTLEQTKLKFKAQSDLNDELEKRLEQSTHENQELQLKLSEINEQQELYKKINETAGGNDRLQKNLTHNDESEIINLQRIIEELSQERDELQQQLKNYEDEEELVSQEVENHRRTLEETQQYIANFRRSYEEQLNHLQEEKVSMVQELENANNELERMRIALEDSDNTISQLRAKIQRLENEKHEMGKQLATASSEDFRKKLNSTENDSVKLGSFAIAFNDIFQEFLSQNLRDLLEDGEETTDNQLMEAPLDKKLIWIKTIILRFFESKERLETMLAEKDEVIRKLNMNAIEHTSNSKRSQHQNDQSKSQLLYELNETTSALEHKLDQIKEMESYIKQLEHERNSLYRKIEEQRQSVKNNSQSQATQVFEMLDGTLEIAFTAEETRSMTLDQKFIEMQNIIKNYQELKDECRELGEERDYLQVTLDSVTNKLKAQQSEIEFLNRQIDIMRKEVAAFIKMDDFKNTEKMKTDNKKFKQEIEALRAEKDRLEKEASQEKADFDAMKEEIKKLSRTIEETENLKEKAHKEIQVLSGNLSEKLLEVEALHRQNRDLKQQNEDLARLLEHEKDNVRRKDQEVFELSHQLSDLGSKFEKMNIMLEHEQNESHKKERNLNDLIQQISQLIQKNEKANEQLLQEKEKHRKNEESLVELQKKNTQLSGKVDALSEQLDEEKNKRNDQDRLIADLRRELGYSSHDPAQTRSQSYVQRHDVYRTNQSVAESVSPDLTTIIKLLGKDSNDVSGREEAMHALKKEFSNLVEQNKKLAEKVEGFRNEATRTPPVYENLNRKLRDQGLAIPEKFFEYSKPIDQVEFLTKEYDKLEQERRKLAASLEAQKDDSAAKEFVITSLKNQNSILQLSQEALSKLREDVFSKDAEKKDAARRIEAMKSYFNKNPRIDRLLNHELVTVEQELLKQKDDQIFELHKKIQKLLGELCLKGYDLRQRETLNDPKASQGSNNQLNQMMELMANLVNSKTEQNSLHDSHQVEEENQKLKDKLSKTASKIRTLGDRLTIAINENKALKQKLEKWIKLCLECLETEIKLLKTGERSIDQGKLTEFLLKISKNLSNADKTLANWSTKEEALKKDLTSLAQEAGKLGVDRDIFDSSTPTSNLQRSHGGYLEEDSEQGLKGNKKKTKSKRAVRPDNSEDEGSDGGEDDGSKSNKKNDTISSSFFTAAHHETAKSSNFAENYQLQTNSAVKNGSNPAHQINQQTPIQLTLSQELTKPMVTDPAFRGNFPQRIFSSDQMSFQGLNQQGLSPSFQKRNPFSNQTPEQMFEGSQYNQQQLYGPDHNQYQYQLRYQNNQQDPNDPFWRSRVNSISLTDRTTTPKDLKTDNNYAVPRNRYQDYHADEPIRGKGDGRHYLPEQSQYNLRERYNSPLSSQGNIRDLMKQSESARDQRIDDQGRSDDEYYRKNERITIVDTSTLSPKDQDELSRRHLAQRYKEHEDGGKPNLRDRNRVAKYSKRQQEEPVYNETQDPRYLHNRTEYGHKSRIVPSKGGAKPEDRRDLSGILSNKSGMIGDNDRSRNKLQYKLREGTDSDSDVTEKDNKKKIPKLKLEILTKSQTENYEKYNMVNMAKQKPSKSSTTNKKTNNKKKKKEKESADDSSEDPDGIDQEEENAMKSGDTLMEKAGHILHTIKNLKNYVKTVKNVNESLIDQVESAREKEMRSEDEY